MDTIKGRALAVVQDTGLETNDKEDAREKERGGSLKTTRAPRGGFLIGIGQFKAQA